MNIVGVVVRFSRASAGHSCQPWPSYQHPHPLLAKSDPSRDNDASAMSQRRVRSGTDTSKILVFQVLTTPPSFWSVPSATGSLKGVNRVWSDRKPQSAPNQHGHTAEQMPRHVWGGMELGKARERV